MSFSFPRNNNIPVKKRVEFASNPRVSSNVQALRNLNNVNLETLTLNNTAIAISGEKLNTLTTTAGTASASKALIVDNNKNISDISDIVCDELYVNGEQITGEFSTGDSSNSNSSFVKNTTLGEAKESKMLTSDLNKNTHNVNSTSVDKLNLDTNIIKNKINYGTNISLASYYNLRQINSTSNVYYTRIIYSPELNIYVYFNNNTIFSSTDLITWTTRLVKSVGSFSSITYAPSLQLFVIVGNSSGTSNNDLMATSNDGINWTYLSFGSLIFSGVPIYLVFRSIAWSPEYNLFFAISWNWVNISGTLNNIFYTCTSANGTEWALTDRFPPAPYTRTNQSMNYTADLLIWNSQKLRFEYPDYYNFFTFSPPSTYLEFNYGFTTLRSEWRAAIWIPDLNIYAGFIYNSGRTSYERIGISSNRPNTITEVPGSQIFSNLSPNSYMFWDPIVKHAVVVLNNIQTSNKYSMFTTKDFINFTYLFTGNDRVAYNPTKYLTTYNNKLLLISLLDNYWLYTFDYYNTIKYSEIIPYNRIQNILQYFIRPVFLDGISTTITSFLWNSSSKLLLTNSRYFLEDNNWKNTNTSIQNLVGQISYSDTLKMYIAGVLAPTGAASNIVSGVRYSYNGTTWFNTNIPTLGTGSTGNGIWSLSLWSNELNMFLICNTDSAVTYKILYSYNGINWFIGYTGTNEIVRYIYYSNLSGGFRCFTNRNFLISSNGISWTDLTAYNGSIVFSNIAYSEDLDLFVGNSSTTNILYCPLLNIIHRMNFSTYTSPIPINAISYINDLNIIMLLGTSTTSVVYTNNGINWTTVALPSVLTNTFNTAFYVSELETLFFGFNSSVGPLGSCYYPVKNVNLTYMNNNSITKYKNDPIISWYTHTPANNNNLTCSVYSGDLSLFVIISNTGIGNRVITSPDGINWTNRVSSSDNNWTSICWSSELNLFVAVANSGTGNRVMTSEDGINWTSRTSASNNNWTSICWSSELNLFVVVANSGTGNRVMTSPDGITWTSRTSASDSNWSSVCWSPYLNLFVAVATTGINLIMTSPDGIIWTNRSAPNANQLTSICWANSLGLLVAVASSGTGNRIITSEDGINWNSQISPADNNWTSITFSDDLDLLVAVSSNGTNNIMKSTNGIDWISMSSNISAWNSICWASELGIFLANSSNNIQTSNVCLIGTQNSIILNKSNLINMDTTSNIRNLRLGTNSGAALVNITSNSNNESVRLNYNNSNSNYVDFDYNHPELNITTNGTDKIVNIVNSNNSTTGLAFNSILLNNSQLSKLSVTPGIAEANKVAIVDSSRNISNINNMSANTILINNAPLFTEADNSNPVIQDITPGTASANKMIITDASRNISNLNNISSNNLTLNNVNINSTNMDTTSLQIKLGKSTSKTDLSIPINIKAFAYSPSLNLYIAAGNSSSFNSVTLLNHPIMISNDAITWRPITNLNFNNIVSLIWVPELNLFIGGSRTSTHQIIYSSDGITWNGIIIIGGSSDIRCRSIAWSPQLSLLVAVGVNGSTGTKFIYTSSNGINWSSSFTSSTLDLTSVCWSPQLSLFVTVASINTSSSTQVVMTSPNGTTWTFRSIPSGATFLESVCWSPQLSLFTAVGRSTNQIITSSDGITWTFRSPPVVNLSWNTVIWVSELSIFAACSSDGTNNRIMVSTNGTTWSSVNTTNANINYRTIFYGNGIYLLGGDSSDFGENSYSNNNIALSTNLSSFTLIDTNYTGFSDIIWVNNLNIYIGISSLSSTSPQFFNKPIIMSSDGINWTYYTTNIYQTFSGNLSSIAWASSLSLLFISTTNGLIFRSSDGLTWTQCTTPSPSLSGFTKIVWASSINRLVCIGAGGGNGSSRIIYSSNGITWTYSLSYSFSTSTLADITWSNALGLFVAVFNNNNSDSILTSIDGINWTNRTALTTGYTLNKIIWIDSLGKFFIGGNQYNLYSSNGINWSVISTQVFDNSYINITNKLEWIDNLNILVTYATTSLNSSIILYYTTDLLNWYVLIPSNNNYSLITYSQQLEQVILASTISIATATSFAMYNISTDNINYKSLNASKLKKNNKININSINNSVNTWILPTNTYNNNLTSICYSSTLKLFVAVSNSGTGNRVVTSPDARTWTSRSSSIDNNWTSICWSPELRLFVAVANSGAGSRVMTSPNGTTWTSRASANLNNWTSVCWSPELKIFVAVANSGTNNRIMVSSDGIYWATITFNYNNDLTSVCWSAELGLFVAVANIGSGNRVITSPDGITWSSQTSAVDNNWTSICWSPELSLFVAVASSGTGNRVMTSSNGITWTSRSTPIDNNWTSVCWSSELGIFTAVSNTGTDNRIMTSSDGINWIIRSSPVNNDWTSIIWCSDYGIFVAVANTGTNNRIMRSNIVIPSRYTIINSTNSYYGLTSDQNTGFIGINNTTPTYLLHLGSNSAALPSSSSWNVSSDERLKENIQSANIDDCYNNIKNLPLKYYKWKDNIYPETLDRHKLGWIAQDVEPIIPESIITIENKEFNISDFKSLNSDQIIANMHGAMYKLIQIYEEQKNKISTLENDINDMNTFLNSLS
jgi:hypothetical protein